ncbi:MAG: outer membrane protein assembly factor BamD [Desulfuromonadales bacterium]|jgi:outer membrane protein assembly factor BamD
MRLYLAATGLLFLFACTSGVVPPPKNAETLFQEGEAFFERKLYTDAIASWEKVLESYYSSELNMRAEKRIAEAHFLAEDYLEAAMAYEDFLKQHPGSDDDGDILYKLGMAYYKQILSIDRDQTACKNALATFKNLLARHPDHPKKEEIRQISAECRERLAEHELYVGRFYLKYRQPEPAIRRLQDLLASDPGFAKRDEIYFLLGKAYLKLGKEKEAKEAFATLTREFADSQYIVPVQKLLSRQH